jgi:hypothetical protein
MMRFRKNILPISNHDLYSERTSSFFYQIIFVLLIIFALYGLLLFEMIHWFIYFLGTVLCIIKIFYIQQFFTKQFSDKIN